MGFMEKLRGNIFGVFGTILLFIILIVFLWGDASRGNSSGQYNADANVAGYVNDEEITYKEFNDRVDAIMNQMGENSSESDRNAMREQVWTQIVNERLILQAAHKYGLDVSDEELRDIMFNEPPEQLRNLFVDSTGLFMQQIYQEFLSDVEGFLAARQQTQDVIDNMRNAVLETERMVRLQKSSDRLIGLVGSLVPMSPVALQSSYNDQNTKATGSFIFFSPSLIPDSDVQVSDEEVQKYYDDHKQMYNEKANRVVQYTMIRIGPSGNDSSKVARQFEQYNATMSGATTPEMTDSLFGIAAGNYGTRLFTGTTYTPIHELPTEIADTILRSSPHTVIGPVRIEGKTYYVNVMDVRDSGETFVKAQHILLNSKEDNDSIKAEAEKIAQEARSGAKFEDLVTKHSADQASVQSGGDVGWFSKSSPFVEEFKTAALKGNVGEIIGPVKTQFGYHIIKVTDKSSRTVKLRAINFDVDVSEGTRSQIRRTAESVKKRLEAGEDFEVVAQDLGLQVQNSSKLTSANTPVATSYELSAFAFDAKQGDVSDVVRLPDGSYIIGKLTEINNAGPMKFDDVKEQISAYLKNRKKIEKLQTRAAQVRAGINAGDSLGVASRLDSTVTVRSFTDVTPMGSFPDIGQDAGLSAAAFNLKPGEVSQPIKGDRGYYIVKMNAISKPDESKWKTERASFSKTYLDQQRQAIFGRWFQEFKDNSNIVRNWR